VSSEFVWPGMSQKQWSDRLACPADGTRPH
jgi:hypothetical protein